MITLKENEWISVSIFYKKTRWQKLISQFLVPYVSNQKKNGNISSTYLSFSTVQGEHIRFAFEYRETDIEYFADNFFSQLSDFLVKNPSPETSQDYIGRAFFMNHYNNTIQYNLYDAYVDDDAKKNIRSLISESIMEFFAVEEEDVDDSLVFTFALQIILVFCNAWESTFSENIYPFVRNMISRKNDIDANSFFKPYHDLFTDNKGIIISIYNEVYQNGSKNAMDYLTLKESYSELLSKIDKVELFTKDEYLPLDKMVIQQMGFKKDVISAIYYIIHLCHCELIG